MTLVVDIGNSRIKWARAEAGGLVAPGSALHAESMDEAFDALIKASPERVDHVLVSNVAGEVIASRLVKLMLGQFGVEPRFVATQAQQLGVRCAYDDPSHFGVDRWVALIAAHRLTADRVCVIDAGTTVTFDAVDVDGRHLGGLILAGQRIIASALQRGTRGIGETSSPMARPEGLELLARSTDQAVGYGTMLALASALDAATATVAAAHGTPPTVLLTGGDGPLLQPWLETNVQMRPDLVLEGLSLIAEQS